MRFLPLRHIRESRLPTGFASPGSGRNGIPPPASDVTSCKPFRFYFIPERPWGLPFRAFPPERSRTCLQVVTLMPLRKPLPLFSSEVEKRTRGIDRLQSFAPRPGPYLW